MNKFLKTISKYKVYLLSALAVLLVALVLIVSLASSGNKTPSEPVNTGSVEFVLPVSNATIYKSYNAEELQYNKTLNCWEIHKALDLVANAGEQVLACYDGEVSDIYTNYLEGTTIKIKHSNGITSVYSGLSSETKVNIGDKVLVNQNIGTVGTAIGNETDDGSHVHFELIKDGEKVDPLNYISIGLKD